MTVELLTKLSHMCSTVCNKEPDFQANSCHTVTSLHDATSLQQHANTSCLQLCTCFTACRSSCMTHQTKSETLLSDNRCQRSLPGAEAGSYALQSTKTSALLLYPDHHLIPHSVGEPRPETQTPRIYMLLCLRLSCTCTIALEQKKQCCTLVASTPPMTGMAISMSSTSN